MKYDKCLSQWWTCICDGWADTTFLAKVLWRKNKQNEIEMFWASRTDQIREGKCHPSRKHCDKGKTIYNNLIQKLHKGRVYIK